MYISHLCGWGGLPPACAGAMGYYGQDRNGIMCYSKISNVKLYIYELYITDVYIYRWNNMNT